MNGITIRIIKNLKERVYPVNEFIALAGIEPKSSGYDALQLLIDDGMVNVSKVNTAPRGSVPVMKKLYQLQFEARKIDLDIKRVK